MEMSPFGPRGVNPNRPLTPTGDTYILAAHIQGKVKLPPSIDDPFRNPDKNRGEKKPVEGTVNVVVTTDVNMLSRPFFVLREQGERPEIGVHFRFDNVTYVLNVLDSLAGDNRFVEIRKRRPAHRMLARIEEETKDAKQAAADSREKFSKKYTEQERAEDKAIEDKVAELRKQKNTDLQQMAIQVGMMHARSRKAAGSEARTASHRKRSRVQQDRDEVDVAGSIRAVLVQTVGPIAAADSPAVRGRRRVHRLPRQGTRRRGKIAIEIEYTPLSLWERSDRKLPSPFGRGAGGEGDAGRFQFPTPSP